MNTLCFVVPAHGRLQLAAVCLRQLGRTCAALTERGINASAVVVADDENLELAQAENFATVERDNTQLGRKLNDGYQLAGRYGFDFMVPLGNDDWIHPAWIRLPNDGEIIISHTSSVVREDGRRLAHLWIQSGDGVRVFPRSLLEPSRFRPVDEERRRAMDTSTNLTVGKGGRATFLWHDAHPLQIVDFKTAANLNSYRDCLQLRHGSQSIDPFGDLAAFYPADAIHEMQALYGLVPV